MFSAQLARAQASHPEVLVVYNSAYPDSLAVADHYMAVRNVPSANLCAISPPSTDELSLADYAQTVQAPVQNCLRTAGSTRILYVVMSYLTPWSVSTGPMGVAAVDSYLADIWDAVVAPPLTYPPLSPQPYYADSQSQGNFYQPFQSFASWRADSANPLIYAVWRLDGPSAAIASALVDQAIAAEGSGGVSGQACIDRRMGDLTGVAETGYYTGDFDLDQAATFLRQAGITVVEDANDAEFGTPPAPLTCPNTAFYSGWYSLNHYNDVFVWQTGSIGWHLDSGSAGSGPRVGQSWVPMALQRGIAVTSGSVSEPLVQAMVRPGGAFRNLLEGANVADAFLRNTLWLKWEILNVGDPLYKPFGSGKPPFSPLQPVNSLEILPFQEFAGGTAATGMITLASPAPPGGTTFTLGATGASGVTIPGSVRVQAGATGATFPITTSAVAESQATLLTATNGSLSLKNAVTADPLINGFFSVPAAMNPFPVAVTLVLNAPAPAGGAFVQLSSDTSALTVPSGVTVPAGSLVATFSAQPSPVTASTTATVTGNYAGASITGQISVVPAIYSFTASPTANSGGQVWVTLYTGADPISDFTFQLTDDDPASLPAPPTLTIAANTHYASIAINVPANAPSKTVHLTVSGGGASSTVAIAINGGGASASAPIRVNAGGAAYTDASGTVWSGDTGFTGGNIWSVGNGIPNTAAPVLYQTCRYGPAFSYQYSIPNGAYTVTLKFAEMSHAAAGLRQFNVVLNGTQVLTNFDIFAAAGGEFLPVDRGFPVNVTAGQITVEFTSGAADWPMLNGLDIEIGSTTTPPGFSPIRIDSGGGAYTGAAGEAWSADQSFSGGAVWSVANPVANTADPALYQTCRYGQTFSYVLTVPNGSYNVVLKFAEISRGAAGMREFNVGINGTQVLTNFDIFAAAGGEFIAVDETFPVSVVEGQITIEFTSGAADWPMVSAIDVEAAAASSTIRVNAGGAAVTDAAGNAWAADEDFSGGAGWSVSNGITNTANPALYQTCRYGPAFSYTFTVPNGNHTVVLKFAEVSRAAAGLREFNVSINGAQVLTNFDIFAAAGGEFIAVDKTFPISVTEGQITIQFTAGAADSPMINGIEIDAE